VVAYPCAVVAAELAVDAEFDAAEAKDCAEDELVEASPACARAVVAAACAAAADASVSKRTTLKVIGVVPRTTGSFASIWVVRRHSLGPVPALSELTKTIEPVAMSVGWSKSAARRHGPEEMTFQMPFCVGSVWLLTRTLAPSVTETPLIVCGPDIVILPVVIVATGTLTATEESKPNRMSV
jgi:hypothetical protein